MKLCVIIPVHNEGEEIGSLVESIKRKNIDVVVIDDGSSDNSGVIAQEKGAIVLRNEEKQGKGLTLQRGFQYALVHHYDGVITMDGDGQHDVHDLDTFFVEIKKEPGRLITGTRMGDSRGMPFIRFLTNYLMSSLISAICHQKIPDSQCGYRYLNMKILRDIQLNSHDFEIETEVLVEASKRGYKISSVPIKTIYRNEKSKINPLKDTIRFLKYLVREFKSSKSKNLN